MKLKVFIVVFLCVFILASCGVLRTYRAHNYLEEIDPGSKLSPFGEILAGKFGLMALFAETVYRRNSESPSVCPNKNTIDVDVLMPWAVVDGHRYQWSRLLNSGVTSAEPCYSGGGLYYETYVLKDEQGTIIEAIIAYRGTNEIYDMTTNIAAAIGFEPPQYTAAKERLDGLIDYLYGQNQDVVIYAVGHSLGGGLAQQAGYLSSRISEVFAFNTSPVTNWTSLALKKEIDNHYPTIYRVSHGGEILQPVRFVSTSFTSARYNRYDITLQITEKELFSGHSMKIIACGFAISLLAKGYSDAANNHYYGPAFIEDELLGAKNASRLCSADSQK